MSYNDPFGFVGAIKIPKDKKTVDKVHRILFKKKEMKIKPAVSSRLRTERDRVTVTQLRRMLDSTMKSVNRKSREAGYGDIMKKTRGGKF
jgi:hypothetical protein